MKKKTTLLQFLAICLVSTLAYAQNTVEETRPSDLIETIGPENELLRSFVNPLQANTSLNTNNIFIEQIGSGNLTQVNTNTSTSDIKAMQYGNGNSIRTTVAVLGMMETIRQQGDNHHFAEFANTPSLEIQRQIDQIGNGQNLTIHGNNSISDNMRLTMEGSAKTIVIRNFN
ncbi:hypothetical protein [Maribacter halichondriae]|uniref:hypothetical protein n=1 Tax=Maribacter halichondriae TaxID=2980554 RepID=UPI0023592510|nr:hypothetical protein [Maribacter sp. Hal144]